MSRDRMDIRAYTMMHKERKIITNCPNCGAVITKPGKCAYCGTFIRIANSIDFNYASAPVDMQINIWDGDKVTILPFTGTINNVFIEFPALSALHARNGLITGSPEVELTMTGSIMNG